MVQLPMHLVFGIEEVVTIGLSLEEIVENFLYASSGKQESTCLCLLLLLSSHKVSSKRSIQISFMVGRVDTLDLCHLWGVDLSLSLIQFMRPYG